MKQKTKALRRRLSARRSVRLAALGGVGTAALAVGITSFGTAAPAVAASSASPITIGLSLPLSAATGGLAKAAVTGTKIEFNKINAAGGIDGHKLVLDAQDNSCNTTDAVSSVDSILSANPKPLAILGAYCSVSTEAIMPLVERAQIPLLVDTAGDDDITSKAGVGGNPWVFRWGASNEQAIGAALTYAKKKGIKRIALVTDNTAFGLDGASDVKALAKADGITLLSSDALNLADSNFSSVIARIASEKPQAVFDWIVYLPGAVTFYREYGSQGLANTPLIGGVEIDGNTTPVLKQYKIHGFVAGPYTTSIATPEAKAFDALWKANGGNTGDAYPGYDGYQGAEVLVAALKAAKSLTPKGVQQALKNLDYKPSIMGGTIKFNSHDQATDNLAIQTYTGGTSAVVGLQAG